MKIGNITEELKDQIIELNDLREVAAEYGVIFNSIGKASCPFHKDGKNGNLHLHEKKGERPSYYCYAETCQAGKIWKTKKKEEKHILTFPDGEQVEDGGPGVIGFVMNIERVSYVEACVILMNRAAIPVPQSKIDYKEERYKKKTTGLNKKFYQNLLKSDDILEYLYKRKIKHESIKKWRLGYIPEDDTSAPMGAKVSGRLVFGLREESYDVKNALTVAMAYRTLKDEQPKYYNDYTVEGLYEKKNFLYGLNEARKPIRKLGYAIITEGYTDVIISHQAGIENIVATCGTAFTLEQMDKLRRLTKNLVFWYDGDGPGWNAMIDSMPTLLEMGFRIKVVVAPERDPAEWMNHLGQNHERILQFIKKSSRSALQVLMEEVIDEYEETVSGITRSYESKLMERKVQALDELLPILGSIKDPSERLVFSSMIKSKLDVNL